MNNVEMIKFVTDEITRALKDAEESLNNKSVGIASGRPISNKNAVINFEFAMGEYFSYMHILEELDIDLFVKMFDESDEKRHEMYNRFDTLYNKLKEEE